MADRIFDKKALAFPLEIDLNELVLVTGEANIEQSIISILMTQKGSLINRPFYGSTLNELFSYANNTLLSEMAVSRVKEAILTNEPRVESVSVNAFMVDQILELKISVKVKDASELVTIQYFLPRQ